MLKAISTLSLIGLAVSAPSVLDFASVNTFALRLLDNTYAFQENFSADNFAVSPLSVWNVFALLAEGSSGETFQELLRELRLPSDLKTTQLLHQAVTKTLKRSTEDVLLHGQSAMFVDCSLEIHPEFCQSAVLYDNDIRLVDASNTTKLANDINYYVCVATNGRIRNAVEADMLKNLRMILVDALYFKANWTHPFDPTQTKVEDFYNSQGKTIGKVNMMYHKAPHNIGDSPQIGAQILELSYGRNGELSMLILLPFDGMPLKRLLSNLAKENLDWMRDFRHSGNLPDVDCYVPRFKINSQIDLIPPLQYTGIHTIFDALKAELPGVSDSPLFVSKTVQNVAIEVNEEGTIAASSTVVGIEDRILGQRFEANKEFVFLITERRFNVILFAGVYTKPSLV